MLVFVLLRLFGRDNFLRSLSIFSSNRFVFDESFSALGAERVVLHRDGVLGSPCCGRNVRERCAISFHVLNSCDVLFGIRICFHPENLSFVLMKGVVSSDFY